MKTWFWEELVCKVQQMDEELKRLMQSAHNLALMM
jgi:hypothetical protein